MDDFFPNPYIFDGGSSSQPRIGTFVVLGAMQAVASRLQMLPYVRYFCSVLKTDTCQGKYDTLTMVKIILSQKPS